MRKTLLYTILLLPFLQSCREVILVELDPVEDQVVIVSELTPDKGIDLDLSITAGIFSSTGVGRPQDARIFLSGSDLPSEATAFIYSRNSNKYELRNKDFRPSPGESYTISASLPGTDYQELSASTSIPMPVSVKRANILSINEIEASSGLVDVVFDIEMELDESINSSTYLHISPKRVLSEYKVGADGEVRITFFAETEDLQVVDILESRNAVTELEHRNGVFVDYAKVKDKMVKLRLSSTTLLDPSKDILQNIEVVVHTLSDELYDYHQNLHKQLINSSTSFTSPTSVFSNIDNGIGVFGGMSSSVSHIKL